MAKIKTFEDLDLAGEHPDCGRYYFEINSEFDSIHLASPHPLTPCMNRVHGIQRSGYIVYSFCKSHRKLNSMPFNTKTVMEQKQEFIILHKLKEISFSELCVRFKISRRTGYKWVKRYEQLGVEGLKEQSRRPNQSPLQSCLEVEEHIVALRKENPEWGAKKLFALLEAQKSKGDIDYTVPAKSTISSILKRRGLISKAGSERVQKWQRFEYEEPNALWQMDFKGHFELINKRTCHPLTVMDDHSRFNLCLAACENQQAQTVKDQLINIFRTYGLPDAILADNGAPWGTTGHVTSHNERCFTKLEKWLIQQHIRIIHGKPYHPQTQGKVSRFV